MLDQNTDRMWYVIGAVIIGAAIIFIMNNTFPQLFASIGSTFETKTDETTELVGYVGDNSGVSYDMQQHNIIRDNSFSDAYFNYITGQYSGMTDRFQMMTEPVAVEPNTDYYIQSNLTYDVTVSRDFEIAWIYYDASGIVIPGSNAYNVKSTVVTTPSTATHINVRFGYPISSKGRSFNQPGYVVIKSSDVPDANE